MTTTHTTTNNKKQTNQYRLPSQIQNILNNYSLLQQTQLYHLLLDLNIQQQHHQKFTQKLQSQLMHTLSSLISHHNMVDLCSLLNAIWKSLVNKQIKKIILISMLDSILECIGVTDLQIVMRTIQQRVNDPTTRDIIVDVQYQMLRVINTLLKRISKTTDYYVRGSLHLTITKIIAFLHQSGFQYRINTSNNGNKNEENKIEIQQDLIQGFKRGNISIQFYQQFWGLQKYFNDVYELIRVQGKQNNTPIKQDARLASIRLKKIQINIDSILSYFRINQTVQNKDFINFPIKFLKLPNLLVLQLQDSYFRMVFLVQVIMFCSNLRVFPSKYTMQINQQGKQIVNKIDKKVGNYLQNLLSHRKDASSLIQMINGFLKNDQYWIQLKDNWREKKKTFFRNLGQQPNSQLKKTVSLNENVSNSAAQPSGTLTKPTSQQSQISAPGANAVPPVNNNTNIPSQISKQPSSAKKQLSILQVSQKCQKQIRSRLQIKPQFVERFLQHNEAPVLKKQPISPSFLYYYPQAKQCMDSFDDNEGQTQFQSRNQYNLFEWKAFRSLQRQRIITVASGPVNASTGMSFDQNEKQNKNKYNDYRLLDFIKKRSDVFQGEPRKRVKVGVQQDDKNQ